MNLERQSFDIDEPQAGPSWAPKNWPRIDSDDLTAALDPQQMQVAVKENWYYHDEKANRVYEHKVVAQPGWSTTIGGSMPAVALDHFCKR